MHGLFFLFKQLSILYNLKTKDMKGKTLMEIIDLIAEKINANEMRSLNEHGYIDSLTDYKNENLHELRDELIAMHQAIIFTEELDPITIEDFGFEED